MFLLVGHIMFHHVPPLFGLLFSSVLGCSAADSRMACLCGWTGSLGCLALGADPSIPVDVGGRR